MYHPLTSTPIASFPPMENPVGASERDESNSVSSSPPIPVIAGFWKDLNLEKERRTLDEQGLKIAENQENSKKNRRKLAESTIDFNTASTEVKLSSFDSLLNGYQEEVDHLTKRAKFGENAFLNIFQKLYEAPDPYPALALIAEQGLKLSELESENQRLKVALEEFRTEATSLNNHQETIRRLEEHTFQVEQQMEEKMKEGMEIKQCNLDMKNHKIPKELKDREGLSQDWFGEAKESIIAIQKLHENSESQFFKLRAQSVEDRAAKESELVLLLEQSEQAQMRVLSLELEVEDLRKKLKIMEGAKTKEPSPEMQQLLQLMKEFSRQQRRFQRRFAQLEARVEAIATHLSIKLPMFSPYQSPTASDEERDGSDGDESEDDDEDEDNDDDDDGDGEEEDVENSDGEEYYETDGAEEDDGGDAYEEEHDRREDEDEEANP